MNSQQATLAFCSMVVCFICASLLCASAPLREHLLISHHCIYKHRAKRIDPANQRVIKIAESLARYKTRGATNDDDVIVEPWSIFAAEAEVGANVVRDPLLKDERLEHFRLVEPQEVDVADQPQLLGDLRVHAEVDKLQARIDKVLL